MENGLPLLNREQFLTVSDRSSHLMLCCTAINHFTANQAFLTLSPHVGMITVRVYVNGWNKDLTPEEFEFRYFDLEDQHILKVQSLLKFLTLNVRPNMGITDNYPPGWNECFDEPEELTTDGEQVEDGHFVDPFQDDILGRT